MASPVRAENGAPSSPSLNIMITNKVTLNKGEEDQLECIGYQRSICKTVLFGIGVMLSLGVLLLVTYWRPDWRVKLTCSRCALRVADTVLLKDLQGQCYVSLVVVNQLTDGPNKHGYSSCVPNDGSVPDSRARAALNNYAYMETGQGRAADADDRTTLTIRPRLMLRYFDYRHVRYVWDKEIGVFKKLRGLDGNIPCTSILEDYQGLSTEEQTYKQMLHGPNAIVVEVKSYPRLLVEEVLNPFYMFQICSVILWSLDEYYIYAGCIVLISCISLGVELYETRKQRETLRDMVHAAESSVSVIRHDGEIEEVRTSQLVPGDVFIVPARGCMMQCDAVVLTGNVIVNESMLTGESVPVTKTPLTPSDPSEIYVPDLHKRNTLFCGTHVIQTRFYGDAKVKAVVVRTGYSTAKGELVRSILYPKPMGFKFYQDSMKFILFLACVAALGMTYSIVILVQIGTPVSRIVIRALDIITIVVPPALPAAMTVGTVYAQSRLKKQGIFCISPPRINVCGKLKCVCFDKTGTLTEEGLDLWGVVGIKNNRFETPERDPKNIPQNEPLQIAMATCHSLTLIDGQLSGDPLDMIMFNSISWVLEEPGSDTTKFDSLVPTIVKPIARETYYNVDPNAVTGFEVGIVRQFTFSSGLQRMSVIVRVLGAENMQLYCKGAPEKIASLCKKETLPDDFIEALHQYTMKGFRVLAMAYRDLDPKLTWHQAQRVARDKVECELRFCGLMIMENSLKPETTPVIRQLQEANIRTIMVTGDNLLTAISVARQCHMVGPKERVILVNAHPPDGGKPARIHWEYAEADKVEIDNTQAGLEANGLDLTNVNLGLSINTDQQELTTNDYYQTAVEVEEDHRYHFAISGRSFAILRNHFPELIDKLSVRGTIFARMGPDQKSQLVEHLQDLDYCVGMCGDGANDCGALKTAHVGISLSEAEASVASPFTSKTANIECVPTCIREGRAALTTSFGVFKYMALYSMVQFISVLILYTMESNLGDWMFLYIDLVITTTVAVLMGHTGAYPLLVAKRPPGSLVAPSNIFSIVMHIIIVCVIQTSGFLYLTQQPWYEEPHSTNKNEVNVETQVTTVIFSISAFQYIILAFIFSKGPPYRKPIWTNVPFLLSLIILTAVTTFLVLYPVGFIRDFLQIVLLPSFIFRLTLIGIVCINFFLSLSLESFIIPSRAFNALINSCRRKKLPKNKYKLVERDLRESVNWPPVGEVSMAHKPEHSPS